MSICKGLTEEEMLNVLFEIPEGSDDYDNKLDYFEAPQQVDLYFVHSDETDQLVTDENVVYVEPVNQNDPIVIYVPHDPSNYTDADLF